VHHTQSSLSGAKEIHLWRRENEAFFVALSLTEEEVVVTAGCFSLPPSPGVFRVSLFYSATFVRFILHK
jgi:hypothetical protein